MYLNGVIYSLTTTHLLYHYHRVITKALEYTIGLLKKVELFKID